MKYPVTRNESYDFNGQSYASLYPNLHKYPATMLPQIGIEVLGELGIQGGKMLDPYCGSGSSFSAGLDRNFSEMHGFDINPLAVLIAKTKFTKISPASLASRKKKIANDLSKFVKKEKKASRLTPPGIPSGIRNVDFWFSDDAVEKLSAIKYFVDKIRDEDLRRLFLVAFSETVRECSYTRNNEFKLYRMRREDMEKFNPDVLAVYFDKLGKILEVYQNFYLPRLRAAKIKVNYGAFERNGVKYDVVLTSPPYGDSKTTVAYGQFSMFANAWLGFDNARQIDGMLMGGKTTKDLYDKGVLAKSIKAVAKESLTRAQQVSAFYRDLETSIAQVAGSVKKGGMAIYVVGNRRVKNVQLPTDQFIAEKFEERGFGHVLTYERLLGNKSMPLKNSPTNQKNQRASTMTHEYIVVCER